MYYPIIDKLKELMTDITSVKSKEPLVIEGTLTSQTGGTWVGNYSDIQQAFSNNRMVLFKVVAGTDIVIVPVAQNNANFSTSILFPFNIGGIHPAYGTLISNNTFNLAYIE